jgi:hypothetical protein
MPWSASGDLRLPDFLGEVTADCPKRQGKKFNDENAMRGSTRRRQFSSSRSIAGLSGFLIFSQLFERPD